jgi:hypothetical protein
MSSSSTAVKLSVNIHKTASCPSLTKLASPSPSSVSSLKQFSWASMNKSIAAPGHRRNYSSRSLLRSNDNDNASNNNINNNNPVFSPNFNGLPTPFNYDLSYLDNEINSATKSMYMRNVNAAAQSNSYISMLCSVPTSVWQTDDRDGPCPLDDAD